MSAQQIGGSVYRKVCGEKLPASGHTVVINFPGPYNAQIQTDWQGNWDYVIWSSDPSGLYTVTVQGNSSPSQYTFFHGGASNTSMNFSVPVSIDEPILISECNSSEFECVELNSNSFTDLNSCNSSSFAVPFWDALVEFNVEETCDVTPFPGCAKIVTYKSNENKEILGVYAESEIQSYTDCWDACADATPIGGSDGVVRGKYIDVGGHYLIELQYGCCDRKGNFNVLTKKRGWAHIITEPDAPDVEFDFITSLTADGFSGNDPIDGIEPTSLNPATAPKLGRFSIGIDANVIGGTEITGVTYTIEEVTCGIENPDGIVIFEESFPLYTGQQPENFLFIDQFLDDEIDSVTSEFYPYFIRPENVNNKCFRVTVTVSNVCGEISKSSLFSITNDCYYCFQEDEDGELDMFLDRSKTAENSTDKISIFPNPAKNLIQVIFDNNSKGRDISLLTSSGELLKTIVQEESGNFKLDISYLPSGVYYLKFTSDDSQSISKFIKL